MSSNYHMYNDPRQLDKNGARKSVSRKTIDPSSTLINLIHYRKFGMHRSLNPHSAYKRYLLPPSGYTENPSTSMCTKFCRTSINKQRCPVNCVRWTPGGRRLITGNYVGEFTLWNGTAFNFETILQAHEDAVRSMTWSHNDNWMLTGDHGGVIKYWQPSMTNVQILQAHKEPVRALSFSPTDYKFISCSDDATIRIWDFESAREEHMLTGHGWDVKTVDYHPHKGLIASGSKDNLIKLWDPKSGNSLFTLHSHKNTVMKVVWNKNGNWLLSASRDQLIKLYDIRTMKEFSTLKGHSREVTTAQWHPIHENLITSGSSDGELIYWVVGHETPQISVPGAHESAIWDIQWHPVGHVVATASNDHTTKFWCQPRPGDAMVDRYNVASSMKFDFAGVIKDDTTKNAPVGSLPGLVGAPAVPTAPPPLLSTRRPPPENYTCNRCGTKGHWLEDCPTKDKHHAGANAGPPPAGYICKRCNVPGHYISACPQTNKPPDNYTCHRCQKKGHWKQDCPNAGGGGGGGGMSKYGGGNDPMSKYGGSGDRGPPAGGLLSTPPQRGQKRRR